MSRIARGSRTAAASRMPSPVKSHVTSRHGIAVSPANCPLQLINPTRWKLARPRYPYCYNKFNWPAGFTKTCNQFAEQEISFSIKTTIAASQQYRTLRTLA